MGTIPSSDVVGAAIALHRIVSMGNQSSRGSRPKVSSKYTWNLWSAIANLTYAVHTLENLGRQADVNVFRPYIGALANGVFSAEELSNMQELARGASMFSAASDEARLKYADAALRRALRRLQKALICLHGKHGAQLDRDRTALWVSYAAWVQDVRHAMEASGSEGGPGEGRGSTCREI